MGRFSSPGGLVSGNTTQLALPADSKHSNSLAMKIDPAEAAVGIEPDANGECLNLMIGHPDFAGIDETLQLQAAFRWLDDLLGEDGTEKWVGSLDVVLRRAELGHSARRSHRRSRGACRFRHR